MRVSYGRSTFFHDACCKTMRYPSGSWKVAPDASQYGLKEGTRAKPAAAIETQAASHSDRSGR